MEEREASPSSLKVSVVFTLTNEGFRMYIPIRISSPVGERTTAHIPETLCSLHAPLANSTVAGFTRSHWTRCDPLLGGREAPGLLTPLVTWPLSGPSPSFSGVRLFLMVTVIVSTVTHRPSCPGLSARGQCPLQ